MRLRSAADHVRARLPHHLRWEPWSILVPLIVVQWLVVADIAHRAQHNGWLFYHDSTATQTFTTSWILGGGHIPRIYVGHALPLVFAPVTWITGPNFVAALHVILPIQILVLLPLGTLGAYVLGARSGGRLIGYIAAATWTLAPLASLHYFVGPYWLDQTLPAILGLTELRYLPGMLAVLLAGVLVLRALDERRLVDAAAAGVAAGFAIGIEPTNVFFLAAPLVAFAVARRARELAVFTGALAPCLLTYLLWRERGLGHVGTLSQALLFPGPTQFTWWYNLHVRFIQLQTASWSPRLLEWIAVAGFVALLKRSPVKAMFFGTWVVSYVLAGGAWRVSHAEGIRFWHLWMPAFPAYCVLIASLPLLWPRSDRTLSERFAYRPRRLVPVAVPAVVALLAILVPLAAVAAVPPLHDRHVAAELPPNQQFVPIDRGIHAAARVDNGRVTLSWQPLSLPAKVYYAIYRMPGHVEGVDCTDGPGATRCLMGMPRVGTTRETTYSELRPKGEFTYRVAALANPQNSKLFGSIVIFVSPPVTVRAL